MNITLQRLEPAVGSAFTALTCRCSGPTGMEAKRSLFDLVAVVAIIAVVVVSDDLLLGIVAILLLRILDVLIDIRNSLDERPVRESASG